MKFVFLNPPGAAQAALSTTHTPPKKWICAVGWGVGDRNKSWVCPVLTGEGDEDEGTRCFPTFLVSHPFQALSGLL